MEVQQTNGRSWNIAKALTLRIQKHLSYRDIGKVLEVDHRTVFEGLRGFTSILEQPELIGEFREHEAELLDGVRMELVRSLADDLRVKKGKGKLSGYQKVGMYGILFDKMRLLRNESTANVSNLTAIIQAALGPIAVTTTPSVSEGEIVDSVPDNEAGAKLSKRID